MSSRKQSKRGAAKSVETKEANATPEASPDDRPSIHSSGLYDLQQIKRFLDDEVISFMENQGYVESTVVSNVRLVCGAIAVVAAVYSHFGVGEFPASRQIVLSCVIIYAVCSLLITITSFLFEASAIFVGTLTPRAKLVSKDLPPKVWVHTTLGGKGSSAFRVEIRKSVRGKTNAPEGKNNYEIYFTKEGYFLRQLFTENMKSVLDDALNSKKSQ